MAPHPGQSASPNPAEMYEQYLVPAMFLPWAPELIERVAPKPGERVLDLACGTGAVARQIAPLVGESGAVVGLDVNPGMLAVAGAQSNPDGGEIEWREGSAEAIPLGDASVDMVLCQQGLQFFPERSAAVTEMRRVVRPGGRTAISVWRDSEHQTLLHELDVAIDRQLDMPDAVSPFSLGDRDELRGLLDAAGFTVVSIDVVTRTVRFPTPDLFVRLMVMGAAAAVPEFQQMDDAARNNLVQAVREDMDEPLRNYRDGDQVAFPMSAHVAVAWA